MKQERIKKQKSWTRGYSLYKHTAPNGKVYIGITGAKPEIRWQNGTGYHRNTLFYRAIKKYGWENIKHEILLDNLTKEQAEELEIDAISRYNSANPIYGYNIANGGNTTAGYKFTENQRNTLSKAKTRAVYCIEDKKIYYSGKELKKNGYDRYLEVCKGIRKTCKNKHFIFLDEKELYDKNIKNIQKGLRRKIICLNNKKVYESISEASKSLNIPYRSIMSCVSNSSQAVSAYGLYFRYYSTKKDIENAEKIINEIQDKKWVSSEAKRVKCLETGKIYNNLAHAKRETNISHISECCNEKRKTAGKLHWAFV